MDLKVDVVVTFSHIGNGLCGLVHNDCVVKDWLC